MEDENCFYLQLAKTIQAWLGVETELYLLYSMLMRGANTHLISVTFNNIQSVDSKLTLLSSCFSLIFSENSEERKDWKALFNKVEKLNKKRNKIVHEPVSVVVSKGERSISLGPSHLNALALVKKQTTNKTSPVISEGYDPRSAKLLVDHRLDLRGIKRLEQNFKDASLELREFREKVVKVVETALKTSQP